MHHRLVRFHEFLFAQRHLWPEELIALLLAVLFLAAPVTVAKRFQDRSLYMNSVEPGATTSYKISFSYMSPDPVGSVDMQFCIDPIPHHPCVTPPGLDVSNAVLAGQTGESGFSILSRTTNRIILSRSPTMGTSQASSYNLDAIINPTDTEQSFSVRLKSHASGDATGPQIDFGSVRGQVTSGIVIETQVPPMLIFCVAEVVADDCFYTNENYYVDMGQLTPSTTLTAQSQMAVGTNASGGFAITANGTPLSAGTNVIDGLSTPSASVPGTNQFGINLVANTVPDVGNDPEGIWANAVPSTDYGIPDLYKFVPGDVVAFSPNVSLMKKFTVSYIINSSPELRAGIYTTTISYIASGRF
ncbi:MAG TPA: hypothetical protein PLN95_00365 [Candidatus Saccharibacteria bacterium]|nr:hypothetical protein [Candidatus Saccharibacteria bacterium]